MAEFGGDPIRNAATGRQGELIADVTQNGATAGANLRGITITSGQSVTAVADVGGASDIEVHLHAASGAATFSIQGMLLDGTLHGTAVTGTVGVGGAAFATGLFQNLRGKRRVKVTIAASATTVMDRAEYNAL